MYNVTLKEVGSRLKQIRNYLGLSQQDLAEKLKCKQVAISRLENGGYGGTLTFLTAISFYSQYVYINYLFAEEFYLVSTDKDASRNNLDSIISKIIADAVREHDKDITEVHTKLKETLERAIGLLKG